MTSRRCMTSFMRNAAICLVSMPKMHGKQQSLINYVFETDIKRKKHC